MLLNKGHIHTCKNRQSCLSRLTGFQMVPAHAFPHISHWLLLKHCHFQRDQRSCSKVQLFGRWNKELNYRERPNKQKTFAMVEFIQIYSLSRSLRTNRNMWCLLKSRKSSGIFNNPTLSWVWTRCCFREKYTFCWGSSVLAAITLTNQDT